MTYRFYRSFCVLILLSIAASAFAQSTRLVDKTGNNSGNCTASPCATINYAISQAVAGDEILVNNGVYTENLLINKNVKLKSVNGSANTIIDGRTGSAALGTVQLVSGSNGVIIGSTGKGFTILGIDGTAGLEKAAVYLQGAQTNITIEGNEIVARGDAALMTEFSAVVNGIFININTFSGKTFVNEPDGDGFTAQFSLQNVPRQVIVIGGGSGTTNTQNITFTNNIVSAISGGTSTTDNTGTAVAPHPQGNTMVTIDAVGDVIITGNVFSGTTTNIAEALRARGVGSYVISGNTMFGSYPRIFSSATNPITIGQARAQDVYNNNSMNGTLDGHIIYNNCTPFEVSIADVFAVDGQAPNTIYLGYGPQSVTLNASVPNCTYNYSWTSNRGNNFSGTTSITVSPIQTTTYIFTATDPFGCASSASITIRVLDIRDGNSKVFVCCNGKTNSIAISAVPAHLAHGDQLGACESSMRKTDHIEKGIFSIYPNPASASFVVKSDANSKIIIYDQQGRVIEQQMNGEGVTAVEFNVDKFSKGIYIVEVHTENNVQRQKLIVQ